MGQTGLKGKEYLLEPIFRDLLNLIFGIVKNKKEIT